jgi:hypothetical protein
MPSKQNANHYISSFTSSPAKNEVCHPKCNPSLQLGRSAQGLKLAQKLATTARVNEQHVAGKIRVRRFLGYFNRCEEQLQPRCSSVSVVRPITSRFLISFPDAYTKAWRGNSHRDQASTFSNPYYTRHGHVGDVEYYVNGHGHRDKYGCYAGGNGR